MKKFIVKAGKSFTHLVDKNYHCRQFVSENKRKPRQPLTAPNYPSLICLTYTLNSRLKLKG